MVKLEFLDLLLFFAYTYLYYLFVKYRATKMQDAQISKLFIRGFTFRIICCLLYSLFTLFLSPSDATGVFFPEADFIYKQMLGDFSKIEFLWRPYSENNFIEIGDPIAEGYYLGTNIIMIKAVIISNFFSFGNFLTSSLLFSILAFEGSWKLFKTFNTINPSFTKFTGFCFLFIPTVIFWTSGIVKEAFSIFCLGYITHHLYYLFKSFTGFFISLTIVLLLSWLLYYVKSYTLVSYLPFIILFFFQNYIYKKAAYAKLNFVVIICFIVFSFTLLGTSNQIFNDLQIDALAQNIDYQQTQFKLQADDQSSSFNLGVAFDPSPAGLLKAAPYGLVAALFRPFPWEAKKLTTAISALESMLLLLSFLYVLFKVGIIFFMKQFFKNPIVFFCFLFSLVFACFCGLSTLNFGSLARYKLPCIQFFVYALIIIYVTKQRLKT
jgi:hypothetical protein